jgi:crotonobetainyl-CoA:carnitine CoA-transferase CaiB-like acyl-CoA transferase
LRQKYGDEMAERWAPLMTEGAKLSIPALVDRIVDVVIEFIAERPAYIPLQSAPRNYKRDPAARNRLRGHFAAAFMGKQPGLAAEDALRMANVCVQVVKGMGQVFAAAKVGEREEIVVEYKVLLTSYLSARLRG